MVKTVTLCNALILRKLHKLLYKLGLGDVSRSDSYGLGAIMLIFCTFYIFELRPCTEKRFARVFILKMILLITHTSGEVH